MDQSAAKEVRATAVPPSVNTGTQDIDKRAAKEILWGLYENHYTHLRHYHSQLATTTNLVMFIEAALMAFVTYDKAITRADIPLTVMIVIIGLVGAGFSMKFQERISLNYLLLIKSLDKLDELLFDAKLISPIREEAEKQQRLEYPRMYKGSLRWVTDRWFWILLPILLSLTGLALTAWAIFWPQG